MLDLSISQAAGLKGLATLTSPRLVAVISHRQPDDELPLIWSLCHAWSEMGLPVLVLDGIAVESDDNPGLSHRLNHPFVHWPANDVASLWDVMPAGQGLAQLSNNARGLPESIVGDYGVVLVYAPIERLPRTFKAAGLAPLLPFSSAKSAVSAYRVLKHLVLHEQWRPTVANIATTSGADMADSSLHLHNLQRCAIHFLGFSPEVLTLRMAGETLPDDVQRLALRLLEHSVELQDDHRVMH